VGLELLEEEGIVERWFAAVAERVMKRILSDPSLVKAASQAIEGNVLCNRIWRRLEYAIEYRGDGFEAGVYSAALLACILASQGRLQLNQVYALLDAAERRDAVDAAEAVEVVAREAGIELPPRPW